jgi:rubrerythrin
MKGNDAGTLEALVRREARSLLQYVRDSFPWITSEEQQALAELQTMIEEEQQALGGIARFLARRYHFFPSPAPYPMAFTSINYTALEHVLPLVVDATRQSLDQCEPDRDALADPEARILVQKLIDSKRQHLKRLETLAAEHPQVCSTMHG